MTSFKEVTLNRDVIFSKLIEKGNSLVCTEDMQIIYPKRFDSRGFTQYTDSIRIMGIFALLDTVGNYAVHNLPNRMVVMPSVTDSAMIDDEEHVVMTFYKGHVLCSDTTMVKDASYLSDLYNELIVLGKIPKFFSYTDLLRTFKRTLEFNGSPVGRYNAPMELLLSLIARDMKDKSKPYRYVGGEGLPGEVYYVGLSNIHYTVTQNINKIGGAYASQAIFSAIGNEREMSELEELLLT